MSLAWWSTCPGHEEHSKRKPVERQMKIAKMIGNDQFWNKNTVKYVCVCAVNIKCSLRLAHTQPAQIYEYVCVCVCMPVSVVVRKLSTSHAQTRTSTPQDRAGGGGQSGLLAVASVSGTHTNTISQSLQYVMVRKTAERRVQSADDLPAWVCHM